MRKFNVTGLCVPEQDYMCDISGKISQIAAMIERGEYFTINRARQYGKTTMLSCLEKTLRKDYIVIRTSFEGVDSQVFETSENFCQGFLHICSKYFNERGFPGSEAWIDSSVTTFDLLDSFLTKTCQNKKIVLMIDETDKASNNFIFLKFLGMLRDKYLKRKDNLGATFQSVILAGVYDIKNLKLKMIQDGTHQLQDGEKRINSPWNIAVDFEVDMSFSEQEISAMLIEYENDHRTGMDLEAVSKEIRAYTSGYPYLVSRLCQIIDTKLDKDWSLKGVQSAVKVLFEDNNLLFDDLGKNLNSNEELYRLIYNIIMCGMQHNYSPLDNVAGIGIMYGFLKREKNVVIVSNRIFEVLISDYFLIKEKSNMPQDIGIGIVENGKLNMETCLIKFMQHYYELYSRKNHNFLERECRLLFLTYLKPLINGYGFYHFESQTRNQNRIDVIVDYGAEQFIVELKLWYGDNAHEKALEQISGYLSSKNKDTGYLMTFDFRKKDNIGEPQAKWVEHNGKRIFDCMVGI